MTIRSISKVDKFIDLPYNVYNEIGKEEYRKMRVLGIVDSVKNRRLVECELCECNCGAEFTRVLGSKQSLCRACDYEDYMTDYYDDRQQEQGK